MSAIAILMVISTMAAAFLKVTVHSSRQTVQRRSSDRLDDAAQSAVAVAAQRIWGTYVAEGGSRTVYTFRQHLQTEGILNGAEPKDILGLLGLYEDSEHGGGPVASIGGVGIDTVTVQRFDDGLETQIYIDAQVSVRGVGAGSALLSRRLQQAFKVEGGDWKGLDYALLANNVNCIMCHAEIGSAERYFNTEDLLHGTFDRVKVGTLEDLLLRSSADSIVEGTLYVRGRATQKDGTPIVDWGSQTLNSAYFDEFGRIQEDAWGDVSVVDLDPTHSADPMQNLYLDYEMDELAMVDGYLPNSFPAPFPDDGGFDPGTGEPYAGAAGNRVVDDVEFEAAIASADGSITASSIFIHDGSNPIDSVTDLGTAVGTGNRDLLDGSTTGDVILVGTLDNPIRLDGQVAIRGDLIMMGYVKGQGSLMVAGNVYVPTDLQYVDGQDVDYNRTFGTAPDGVSNQLAIASGGSVIVGDLFKPKRSRDGSEITGREDGAYSFVLSEVALFNRKEWSLTQPVLPGVGESYDDRSSWTAVNHEYRGPDYLPRYYVFNDGGTIPFFENGYFEPATGSWVGKEHNSKWTSDVVLAYPGDPQDPFLFDGAGNPIAAVHELTSRAGWITDDLLKGLMRGVQDLRPDATPLQIDALLYSNNSIFGIVPKASSFGGQMVVNGAIVAADVGLLVAGNGGVGLRLNYDPRLKELLDLKSGDNVQMTRMYSVPSPIMQ